MVLYQRMNNILSGANEGNERSYFWMLIWPQWGKRLLMSLVIGKRDQYLHTPLSSLTSDHLSKKHSDDLCQQTEQMNSNFVFLRSPENVIRCMEVFKKCWLILITGFSRSQGHNFRVLMKCLTLVVYLGHKINPPQFYFILLEINRRHI